MFQSSSTRNFFSKARALRKPRAKGRVAKLLIGSLCLGLPLLFSSITLGGFGFGRGGAVGGISIDALGVVKSADNAGRQAWLDELRQEINGAPAEMAATEGMRKISLRKLQAALEHAMQTGGAIPEEVSFLGGLQRIEYVFVYPEKQDIVLAGYAENWKVNDAGSVVGVKSGRPVVMLDDLLVAIRSVAEARESGLTCSIDPTEEGTVALRRLLDGVRLGANGDPRQLEPAMQEAFGPQQVALTGVPQSSHLARVMLAADYKMKRIAMNLDASPVRGLTSYLQMMSAGSGRNQAQSRWWLACDYEPIQKSEDGLSFQIRGRGMKAMTEEEAVGSDGDRKGTGKVNKLAQKWADNFTTHLDELSVKEPIFGDLRNAMDLCVVAALIEHNGLEAASGCDLSVLRGKSGSVSSAELMIPKTIAPHCSFVRSSGGWMVSASGGVSIDSWTVVEKQAVDKKLSEVREQAQGSMGQPWWWN